VQSRCTLITGEPGDMTTNHTVENAALGAGISTGLMGVITQNATAISVIATVGFGVIYASCAIYREYQTYKRDKISKKAMLESIIDDMIKKDEPIELIKIVQARKDKL